MQLIFLRNGEQSRTALDLILKLIADTQGPLRIAVAYFNYLEIADAIVRRSELGRATFMIVNSSDLLRPAEGFMEYEVSEAILRILGKGSWTSPLEVRSLGLPSPQYHNMHHKFAVGDDRAIFGSVNWTRAALSTNFELMAVTQDAELVNAFSNEFETLWGKAHPLYGQSGKLRVIVCPNCQSSGSVDFESWGARCVSCMAEFRPSPSRA